MLPKEKAKLTGKMTDAEISDLSDTDLLDLYHTMKRHADFEVHQMDYKHAMHLVRLLRIGVEALTEGVIKVKRPDAAELLEIRNGKWTYEQIVEYAEMMDKKVREELYLKTSLPKKPDIHLAAELILKIQDMTWTTQNKK